MYHRSPLLVKKNAGPPTHRFLANSKTENFWMGRLEKTRYCRKASKRWIIQQTALLSWEFFRATQWFASSRKRAETQNRNFLKRSRFTKKLLHKAVDSRCERLCCSHEGTRKKVSERSLWGQRSNWWHRTPIGKGRIRVDCSWKEYFLGWRRAWKMLQWCGKKRMVYKSFFSFLTCTVYTQ